MWNSLPRLRGCTRGVLNRLVPWHRPAIGDIMETQQFHFKQVHKITVPNGPIDAMEMTCADIPADAKTIVPKESAVEIRFVHSHPNITVSVYIYAARKNDDICQVAWGTVTTGAQQTDRGIYADRIVLFPSWLSPITIVGNNPNGMARICMRTHGYHRLFVRIDCFKIGVWYVDMAGMSK